MRRTTYLATTLVVCGAALAACVSDQAPLAPQSGAPKAGADQSRLSYHPGGPLQVDTIWYFVCNGNGGPYTGSAVIGPLGGTVTFGPHELIVPPGALFTPTTITAQTLASDTIAVQFQPQGLTFAVPATLELSYAQCQQPPSETLSIVYVNDLLNQLLGLVQSVVDPGQQMVVGLISHFSAYAVAE
jgi:hypothetical protein